MIDLLPDQRRVADKGGTMRLGLDPCRLLKGSRAEQAYGDGLVFERHRHRYEVNNRFRRRLEDAGLVFSGTSPDGRLVEMIELPDHPGSWPASSTPSSAPPDPARTLFRDFVGAATVPPRRPRPRRPPPPAPVSAPTASRPTATASRPRPAGPGRDARAEAAPRAGPRAPTSTPRAATAWPTRSATTTTRRSRPAPPPPASPGAP